MNRSPLSRISLFAVVAVLAVAIVCVALLKAGGGHAQALTSAYGWTIPIVSGLLIAAVAWLLLNVGDAEDDAPISTMTCRCSACGEPVIRGWRLCPNCGKMVPAGAESYPEDVA